MSPISSPSSRTFSRFLEVESQWTALARIAFILPWLRYFCPRRAFISTSEKGSEENKGSRFSPLSTRIYRQRTDFPSSLSSRLPSRSTLFTSSSSSSSSSCWEESCSKPGDDSFGLFLFRWNSRCSKQTWMVSRVFSFLFFWFKKQRGERDPWIVDRGSETTVLNWVQRTSAYSTRSRRATSPLVEKRPTSTRGIETSSPYHSSPPLRLIPDVYTSRRPRREPRTGAGFARGRWYRDHGWAMINYWDRIRAIIHHLRTIFREQLFQSR